MAQTFTALGAARFLQDLIAIQAVVDSSCLIYRQANADLEMDKLKQGVILLNLPVEDEVRKALFSCDRLALRHILSQPSNLLIF